MEKYQYSPELRKPGFGVDVNNDGPLMRLYIPWCKFVNNVMSVVYQAPAGVRKSQIHIPVRDGNEISAFLLEPEACDEVLPVVLFCHGGAFFMPVLPSSLAVAASYVQKLRCRVIMPEYRLTPKFPYPVPLDDCYDTLRYLTVQAAALKLDMEKLVVYGESAGGCLAAGVMYRCGQEKMVSPVGQMLIYPVTDNARDYPSLTEYQFATWTKLANENMWKLYLSADEPDHWGDAVPMRQQNVEAIPATYIEAAEMDTLRDQALAYAKKLQGFGVQVRCETVPGAYHGFDGDLGSPLVQRVLACRVEVLRNMIRAEIT